MKKLLFVIAILTSLSPIIRTQAQTRIDTIYYDKNWNVVPHRSFADYYRVALYPSNPSAKKILRDYYITGELQAEGGFVHIGETSDSSTIFDGKLIIYYKNGKMASERVYVDGKLNGDLIEYNDNGLVISKSTIRNDKIEGIYTKFFENGNFMQAEFSDGKPVHPYYIYGDVDGHRMKLNNEDNTPYWETPSREERKIIYRQGTPWQYYVANGLSVALTVTETKDYGKWFRTDIIITNNSPVPIIFDAENISGVILTKSDTLRDLRTWTCAEYMKRVNNRQAWAAAMVGFAEGMATSSAGYSTTTTSSSTYYNGNSYSYGNASSYGSGGYAYGSYSGRSTYSGTSNTYSRSTTYDAAAAYQAQVLSAQRMADFSEAQWQERQAKNEGYIKKSTINPGETITGYVLIERKPSKELCVIVNIFGAEYKYDWNTQH